MLPFLLISLALFLQQSLAQVNADADGFNIYKDLLRAKPDEGHAVFENNENPAMYVYRSPSWLLFPSTDSPYNKRGVNHFKSIMLSPNREEELVQGLESQKQDEGIYHFPRVIVKRSAVIDSLERLSKSCAWPDNAARLMAKRNI